MVNPQYGEKMRLPLYRGSREEKGVSSGAFLSWLWCGFNSNSESWGRSLCISTGRVNSTVPSKRKAWGKSSPAPQTDSQLVQVLTKVKGYMKWVTDKGSPNHELQGHNRL